MGGNKTRYTPNHGNFEGWDWSWGFGKKSIRKTAMAGILKIYPVWHMEDFRIRFFCMRTVGTENIYQEDNDGWHYKIPYTLIHGKFWDSDLVSALWEGKFFSLPATIFGHCHMSTSHDRTPHV